MFLSAAPSVQLFLPPGAWLCLNSFADRFFSRCVHWWPAARFLITDLQDGQFARRYAMARGLSKNTQGFKGATPQRMVTSKPMSKTPQLKNTRINPLVSLELFCAGVVFFVALAL